MVVYKILLIVSQDTDALPKTIHALTKIPVEVLTSISWEVGDDLKRLEHEIIRPLEPKTKETLPIFFYAEPTSMSKTILINYSSFNKNCRNNLHLQTFAIYIFVILLFYK